MNKNIFINFTFLWLVVGRPMFLSSRGMRSEFRWFYDKCIQNMKDKWYDITDMISEGFGSFV